MLMGLTHCYSVHRPTSDAPARRTKPDPHCLLRITPSN